MDESANEQENDLDNALAAFEHEHESLELLKAEMAEAHAELDKQIVPPGASLHARIRRLARAAAANMSDAEALLALALKIKPTGAPPALRRKLSDERVSVTHHFSISGHDGYVTVGMYEDGTPGEVFIRMAKEGSTVSGLMDSFGVVVSTGLQYGVPLGVICSKLASTRFDPSGFTTNENVRMATSIMDYLARWLALRFGVDLGMGDGPKAVIAVD